MKTKSHKQMFVAIANNDLNTVSAMTDEGFSHDSPWYHGRTSLHLSIEERKKNVFEYLLKAGVNPNVRDDQYQKTPLHLASSEGYADFVKLLLSHGADITLTDENKLSPLYDAVCGGHLEVSRMLVKAGLDVDSLPARQGTMLSAAVGRSKNEQLVEYLIQQGCDPNDSPNRLPPLGVAIHQFVVCKQYPSLRGFGYFPHRPNVELLLRHGADPNYRFSKDADESMRGRTILEYAREGKISPNVIKMLVSATSKPKAASASRGAGKAVESRVGKSRDSTAQPLSRKSKAKRAKSPMSKAKVEPSSASAVPDMEFVWKKLHKTLAAVAPDVRKSLRRKATEKQVASLQNDVKASLPSELVDSLQVHNGQNPGATCLVPSEFTCHEYEFLTVSAMLRERAVWAELLASGEFRGQCAQSDRGVRSMWYSTDWIPFASNGAGDFLCVDTNPTKQGKMGQVISLDHESAARRLISPSLGEFLTKVDEYWAEVD